MKPIAVLTGVLALFTQSLLAFAVQPNRFFKAECGTSAGYIKLAGDGTYTVIWREHMGVIEQEQGHWSQKQDVIAFIPTKGKKVSYEGMQIRYKGRTFLAWKSENAAGIVVPVRETMQEVDSDPKGTPLYVFFETDFIVYERETREAYPFHYVKPYAKPN